MALPDAAIPFNERTREYDTWFDASPLFAIEIAALRASSVSCPEPGLEIGVGPGRFAQALNICFGLDPAISPLHLAQGRSIIPINGIAEQLPVRSGSIGTLYLLFTLCFLADPVTAGKEFFRVLKHGGCMVTGFIPARSPWGKHLAGKRKKGHPFYRHARFHTAAETRAMLTSQGYMIIDAWSTLFQPPGNSLTPENPRPGTDETAGFCVIIARKERVP